MTTDALPALTTVGDRTLVILAYPASIYYIHSSGMVYYDPGLLLVSWHEASREIQSQQTRDVEQMLI